MKKIKTNNNTKIPQNNFGKKILPNKISANSQLRGISCIRKGIRQRDFPGINWALTHTEKEMYLFAMVSQARTLMSFVRLFNRKKPWDGKIFKTNLKVPVPLILFQNHSPSKCLFKLVLKLHHWFHCYVSGLSINLEWYFLSKFCFSFFHALATLQKSS